jgi:hypothetical protein
MGLTLNKARRWLYDHFLSWFVGWFLLGSFVQVIFKVAGMRYALGIASGIYVLVFILSLIEREWR